MSSIIWNGDTYHGISADGRGVFTNDEDDIVTYAGQIRDGYACGLGVITWPNGTKAYAEPGPDGEFDGRPPHSPPSNRPMDRPARFAPTGAGNRRGDRGAPPRRTPSLVAVRHIPTTAALQSTTSQ